MLVVLVPNIMCLRYFGYIQVLRINLFLFSTICADFISFIPAIDL